MTKKKTTPKAKKAATKKPPKTDAIKYKTSEDFLKGFLELRSKCLVWALACAGRQDEKGFSGALRGIETATSEMIRQAELDDIRETGRKQRQGYTIGFLDEQPETKA